MRTHARVVVIGGGVTGCSVMAQAIESVPVLARAGIRRTVNGPMIFSPDLNPTSAGYGHCAGRTLALGYLRSEAIASNAAYDVEVIGEPRPARRLERPPVDPEGRRMRG